ncbi:hypothetical protein BC827DRAFT_4076 [Russula dissimulans]|nr:hypothetical protein BC827DRAFT_4076 [Russula dissimulans]
MLALSVVMYSVSATHWALFIYHIEVLEANPFADLDMKYWAAVWLPSINYILSDAIVLWRAWVLWNRKFLLFVPPLIFLMCNFGTSVASAILFYQALQMDSAHNSKAVETLIISLHLEWSVWILTLATNLWGTGLIFIRAWQHRRFLRSLSIDKTFKSSAEQVLAFLVESGIIYLCIWITEIFTTVPRVVPGTESFHSAMAQLSGMYPSMIIVVVALRLSTADVLSRSNAEGNSLIIITSPSSSPAQRRLAEDIEKSLDGRSTPALSDSDSDSDAMST